MVRLQDLVDKLQLKVKAYKRQAEEAVSGGGGVGRGGGGMGEVGRGDGGRGGPTGWGNVGENGR